LGNVLPILSDEGPTSGPTNVLPEKMSGSYPVYILKHRHKLSSGIWSARCPAKICRQHQAFPPFSFSKFQVFSEKKGEKVRSRKEEALGQDNPLKHNWPSNQPLWQNLQTMTMRAATVNQQPPAQLPLDAHYYSVMDEPQTEFIFGFTMETNSVGNRSHL
jgi:hypothetical protein